MKSRSKSQSQNAQKTDKDLELNLLKSRQKQLLDHYYACRAILPIRQNEEVLE